MFFARVQLRHAVPPGFACKGMHVILTGYNREAFYPQPFPFLDCPWTHTLRAACADIDQFLGIPSPMVGDVEINLDAVDTIQCEDLVDGPLDTVTVDGGTLTLKSSTTVR